jgi:hypothetical protein
MEKQNKTKKRGTKIKLLEAKKEREREDPPNY